MFHECGTDGKSESSVQNQAADLNMMFVRQCNRGCILYHMLVQEHLGNAVC